MVYTLKQLLNVLDMKTNIIIFKNEKDIIFNGLVYEALFTLKNTQNMKYGVKDMYISVDKVNILLGEIY